jgi:hypothetical protein
LNPTDGDVLLRTGYFVGDAVAIEFTCPKCGPQCTCSPEVATNGAIGGVIDADVDRDQSVRTGSRQTSDRGVTSCIETLVSAVNSSTSVNIVRKSAVDDTALVEQMLTSIPDCVTVAQKSKIRELLLQNVDLFARSEYDRGRTSLVTDKLELVDPHMVPVHEPLRRHPLAHLELINQEIDKLLAANLLTPCQSQWAANVILVRRKTLPGIAPRYGVVVDLRQTSLRLKRIQYTMQF